LKYLAIAGKLKVGVKMVCVTCHCNVVLQIQSKHRPVGVELLSV